MQDMTFGVKLPRYEIGAGAYARVPEELSPFGRRILLIGGNRALSAAQGALEAAIQGSPLEIAAADSLRRGMHAETRGGAFTACEGFERSDRRGHGRRQGHRHRQGLRVSSRICRSRRFPPSHRPARRFRSFRFSIARTARSTASCSFRNLRSSRFCTPA